jgi:uncharacterized membrane protein YheB (UPF0754 family)
VTPHPKSPTAPKSQSLTRGSIFGPAPILEGENAAAYDELLTQVSSALKPSDIIEEIWVRDVVDLTWEIFRGRRLKNCLLAAAVPYALREILSPLVDAQAHSEWMKALVKQWTAQKPSAIKRVSKYLASGKLTFDTVIALALRSEIDSIERIDRSITIAEERRNAVLREIDRRRATFAQTLRKTIHEIEDAEFETIAPKAITPNDATTKNAA